jgi:hypothetical protein
VISKAIASATIEMTISFTLCSVLFFILNLLINYIFPSSPKFLPIPPACKKKSMNKKIGEDQPNILDVPQKM